MSSVAANWWPEWCSLVTGGWARSRRGLSQKRGSGGRQRGSGSTNCEPRAGRCFDRVAAGETIEVVRGGRLLAQIVSAGDSGMVASRGPVLRGRVELGELRARAGGYFDRVQAGEALEVVRGGRVVARIVSADTESRRMA